MNRSVPKVLIVLLASLLLCGCSQAGPPDPTIPYGLLIKSRDFLTFCLFLTDQDIKYYNQIAQRYYYAMLALASITFEWRKKRGVEYTIFAKHDEVWGGMPNDVRKTYGDPLKKLRTRCDYHHEELARDQESYRKELSAIIHDERNIFEQLEEQTRINYAKFFGNRVTDDSIKVRDCDALMDEIKDLNDRLKGRL